MSTTRRLTRTTSDFAKYRLQSWMDHRAAYLDELLRGDGPGKQHGEARCGCKAGLADYRCIDCTQSPGRCGPCLVKAHQHTPLHRIQVCLSWVLLERTDYTSQKWNGQFYAKTSLREAGLSVHLGHDGGSCPSTTSHISNFVVFDLNGFHILDVAFCDCYDEVEGYVPHWAQLLRAGWYPATHARPRSAFTLALMDFFQELNVQSKANLHDFLKTVENITDKCKLGPSKVCPQHGH